MIKDSSYFDSIIRISHRVCQKISICRFPISQRQFLRLLASYRHVEEFALILCKISMPTIPDFSKALRNTNICKLNLQRSTAKDGTDWGNSIEEFLNLIQGLSTSSHLLMVLQQLDIQGCGIDIDKAQQILTAFRFDKVTLKVN
mmetsp:Transcript_37541/g.37092  ORF Transcript_37541/g.37092 Transcript_37541/m.37092 type:complete len:144 (-) Transcript_37541:14-445(-)